METQNKPWVCRPVLDNNGQLGPEDLSSSSKTLQNRTPVSDKHTNISRNEQETAADSQNKNGLDHYFVQQVEDAICDNSRQVILHILEEVTRLTSIEKLLLYLKLPTDLNSVSDPLRQPLNPLGSRTEISQTIMWIRTHLEEDPELSLPKQEVYNEYTLHCANNKMKPLSTADFGKVMKQVYPRVRPRRLGTRGNSRYCYAGLRKRFKLEVPQMPDLGDKPQSTETLCSPNELNSAACVIVCEWAESVLGTRFQSVHALASYLLRHAPQAVNMNSGAATLLTGRLEALPVKDTLLQELPYSNHVNLKHKEAQLQLQRKLQQKDVKRKLQSPKTETKGKCKKSKMQGSGPPSRTTSQDSQESSDSPKSQGYQLNTVCDKPTNEYMNASALPDFSSFQMKKPLTEEGKITNEKPSAAKKDALDITNTDYQIKLAKSVSDTEVSRSNSLENEIYDLNHISDEAMPEPKQNVIRKLPIPKLPIPKIKTGAPKTLLQLPRKGHRNPKYKAIQPKPVKCDTKSDITQGHTEPNLDTADVIPITPDDSLKNADYLTRERLISVSNVDKDALDDYLHGGNNSQEQEEELMQYFKNNDKYDGTQSNISSTQPLDHDDVNNASKSDKLSQLRILLEQNLSSNVNMIHASQISNEKSQKPAALITNMNVPESNPGIIMKSIDKHNWPQAANLNSLPTNLNLQSHLNTAVKRRVSFETSVIENDTVPPSPNTRRKNFSFTPISPGPHSPGGGRQSKCSSTNASPFVSPRNTPVPRAKCTHAQNQPVASFVAQQITQTNRKQLKPLKTTLKHEPEMYNEPEKLFGDFIEEKHFVNPTDIIPKCNLPMSAPPSPMLPYKQKSNNTNLLQKLLDSNSKVSYVPDYEKSVPRQAVHATVDSLSQEVSQLLSENNPQCYTTENSYRSQSVPLHQMSSFKTLMSPCLPNSQQTNFNFNFTSANNSVAPTPVPNEFTEFEPFPELHTGLNNENLNQILNILETSQGNPIDESVSAPITNETTQAPENVFTFETGATNLLNSNILNQSAGDPALSVQKLIRSHSIDVDVDMRSMCEQKYIQSSRSVPNTPLPFTKSKLELELNLNNNQQPGLSGNIYACTQDFLLNGQPVKEKFNVQGENENIELSNETQNFPQSLGFTMNESVNDNKNSNFVSNRGEYFGARRNLNTLLELHYSDSEFQATVPKVNSDT